MKPQRSTTLSGASIAVALAASLMLGGIPAVALGEGTQEQPPAQEQAAPPQKPEGENGSAPPPMPPGEPPQGGMPGQPPAGGPGGPNTQSFDYKGTYSATADANGKTLNVQDKELVAEEADVNAALAQENGMLVLSKCSLLKSGDDYSGDNCNFYGMNAALLSVGENSHAYVKDSSINADAEGANAIFATDKGTVFAKDISIATTKNSARGLDATYAGTVIASNAAISTQGDHCATLATDRGGGNVSLRDSHLSTAGAGSPLLYSTGCIEVSNVSGTTTGSQIAGMEGFNTLRISNSTLESTIPGTTGPDPVANGVIIYQSMSGDADTSTGQAALFQAEGSTLKSAIQSGALFYLTNTTANVVLKGNALEFDSGKASLLRAEGNNSNGWGKAGKNGATVTLALHEQQAQGAIEADAISSASVWLLGGSTWTGAAKGEGQLDVALDASSTWILDENATISNLQLENGARIVDAQGKPVSIAAGSTTVAGESAVTLTVTGELTQAEKIEQPEKTQVTETSIDRSEFDSWAETGAVAKTGGWWEAFLSLIGWPWW